VFAFGQTALTDTDGCAADVANGRYQIVHEGVGRPRCLIRHAAGIVGRQRLRDLIGIDDVQTGRPEEGIDERG